MMMLQLYELLFLLQVVLQYPRIQLQLMDLLNSLMLAQMIILIRLEHIDLL